MARIFSLTLFLENAMGFNVISSGCIGKVLSKNPQGLLTAIKARIDAKEGEPGKIKTWAYDEDGDFTYLAKQYENAAWIRPAVVAGCLDLSLVWRKEAEPSQEVKGIFLGRFIEMIVGHFDGSQFIEAKALPIA